RIPGQHVKRECLQGITHEHSRGLVIGLVAGWATATKVVIIHRRKIVVHERIHVDELDRARSRFYFFFRAAYRLGRGEQEWRPNALAATEYAVAHGFVQPGGYDLGTWKSCGERCFHPRLPRFQLEAESTARRRLIHQPTVGNGVHARPSNSKEVAN